ncbi:MAG: hypothetical protein PHG97_06850 [Candidatus Margulisbacteria bacterium]|nr:hypothetical protein [Candidatus Margulisiibacteriota bacterium]
MISYNAAHRTPTLRIAYPQWDEEVHIIKFARRNFANGLISRIVALAKEVHNNLGEGEGNKCREATERICLKAREKLADQLVKADIVRGLNVPGLSNDPQSGEKYHDLARLRFESVSIAVDVTAAQIKGENNQSNSTQVLLVITQPEVILRWLAIVYRGGSWTARPPILPEISQPTGR